MRILSGERAAVRSTVVAWCSHCEMYSDDVADVSGQQCFMCGDSHKLRKRRGYVCARCQLRNVFFSRPVFLAHQCE